MCTTTPGDGSERDPVVSIGRRDAIRTVAAGVTSALLAPSALMAAATPAVIRTSESIVKVLYDSLSETQRQTVCFDWDHMDKANGLLRTHISNNWTITKPHVKSEFYTADQQQMIREIFEGMVNPDWVERFDKQFKDDMGGFGKKQSIAIFGHPGAGKFEFVLTGRHGTMRCDGDSSEHVAFGGPILYGHAASGYFEKYQHPNNVFWPQAQAANKLYQMLDGKQQKQALIDLSPDESEIAFRKPDAIEGIPVAELSSDQKQHVQGVLRMLIEPYRQSDRDEVVAALKAQGGLDACRLAYYEDEDLGDDKVWDNWRLEGPAFVWHYRGAPHVHVWVNVSDDPHVDLNAKNRSGPLHPKKS
ncbi:MAG: DUF3500 domain-containing protein [Phycisphaera sp.]|nr:DUF3500 domain-containing protein [Phycisphaera sp.]